MSELVDINPLFALFSTTSAMFVSLFLPLCSLYYKYCRVLHMSVLVFCSIGHIHKLVDVKEMVGGRTTMQSVRKMSSSEFSLPCTV